MGADITISTDDPTMFRNRLIDDYFMAIVSWRLSLDELHRMIANVIKYAADLDGKTK